MTPASEPVFVGVETGGTKILCRVVSSDGTVLADVRLPTGEPEAALAELGRTAMAGTGKVEVRGIGLASFGPVVVDRRTENYGAMLATTKPGWSGYNLGARLAEMLDAPVSIDTDVNVAALAEQALGAGRGLHTVAYVTVGTGIGGGLAVKGRTLKGGLHPEIGHVRLRRAEGDLTPSQCGFHPDCAEGLSAGPALGARLGERSLGDAPEVRALAADYLGQLCSTLLLAWSPQRIVLGGGAMDVAGLIPEVEARMRLELNGYGASVVAGEGGYLVAAELENAGLEGALIMAREIANPDVIYLVSGTGADRQAAVDLAAELLPPGGRRRPASVIHATVVLAGELDDRTVSRALQIGDLMRGERFQLVFDRLEWFSNGVAAFTCSDTPEPFQTVRRQLTQAARSLRKSAQGGTRPHLTMAYGGPSFEPIRLTTPLVWDVTEIELVCSVHGETRHEELGRWSLS